MYLIESLWGSISAARSDPSEKAISEQVWATISVRMKESFLSNSAYNTVSLF